MEGKKPAAETEKQNKNPKSKPEKKPESKVIRFPKKPVKDPSQEERPKTEAEEKPEKKRSKTVNRILTAILTLLLIVLAVLVFVFRDELTAESIRRTFGTDAEQKETREAFTYETGSDQVFAVCGDGLAVAGSSCLQLLDAKGATVFKQVISYETPAVFTSPESALFCDLGGSGCVLAGLNGESTEPEVSGDIYTAGINENGWFLVVTGESGYKGLVTVFNSSCEKQYEWWSGNGYVMRACISPDNKYLAVLCAEKEGAKLHFFSLQSDEELANTVFENILLFDLTFLGNDTVCAVGESGLYFVSRDGTVKNEYRFDGNFLLDYNLDTPNFVTVFFSAYRSGAGGTLMTFDSKGNVLGTEELDRSVISLSGSGKQILVMTGNGLALYGQDLVRQYANETLMTAKKAVLRQGGDILLLYAYSAERFSF